MREGGGVQTLVGSGTAYSAADVYLLLDGAPVPTGARQRLGGTVFTVSPDGAFLTSAAALNDHRMQPVCKSSA